MFKIHQYQADAFAKRPTENGVRTSLMKQLSNANEKKYPELLAPAGSFETGRAVIQAGADAVYVGGSQFGARAYAKNFSEEELLGMLDYAHLHDCKIYLTVNTLLKQQEIDSLYDYLLPYYKAGLDAVIVQDYGVMRLIRTCFPDLPLHISTQMSIANACGAEELKRLGAARIVPARELSLEEIRAMRAQTDVELECFVHGALCYSYSGQCLLSSMLGGRSGNRGRCAQPCRLPYTVLAQDGRTLLSKPDSYPLSLKDLCTIDQIPALAAAGIDSFKIEGRMKSADYAAGVTAVYRKYIDAYIDSGCRLESVKAAKQDYRQLLDAGNRSGFTDGYYRHRNGPAMVSMQCPSHEKGSAASVETVHAAYVEKEEKIPVQAEAWLKTGYPARLSVVCRGITVSAEYGMVQAAVKQPVSRAAAAAQLSKTGNTPFVMDTVAVRMDEEVFLAKQELNQLRRRALERLEQAILAPYRRKPQEQTSGYGVSPDTCLKNGNQERRHSSDRQPCRRFFASVEQEPQLDAVLAGDLFSRIYLDSSMYTHDCFAAHLKKHVMRIHAAGAQAYLILPSIFRLATEQFYRCQWEAVEQSGLDGYLVKNQDELGFLRNMQVDPGRCVLDYSLYAYSNYTKSCYEQDGWQYDTVPLELNKKELLARDNTKSELLIYGYLPLMTSAQCIKKTLGNCEKKPGLCFLKDRYARKFPVKNNCGECYNTIYNTQPLSFIQLSGELDRLGSAAFRLQFTLEEPTQIRRIVTSCARSFLEHQIPDMQAVAGVYTNGHYKRGVL